VRDPLQHVAAVATLDAGGVLADVVEGEHTTRRLNLANLVGLGRVRMTTAVCEALDHADCKEPHDYKANITKRRRSTFLPSFVKKKHIPKWVQQMNLIW